MSNKLATPPHYNNENGSLYQFAEAGKTIFETVLGIEKKSNVKQIELF